MIYVALLVISFLLALWLGIYSWRNRVTSGVAAFSLTMFAGAFWSIYHHKLLNLVPVARSKMVDIMQDGMIVLDDDNRFVDINPTAKIALSISEDVIGQSALGVFKPWPLHC
jgi:hypothetical protein